ncbi:copper homeostasis protein CutC [Labrys sp. LIt4]|uniref:copper homeostasis protein CutC n=1 Tax=Labrys sp. LIt4 TaxID=2821355 RepID=UPI001AE0C144|nr:copper homeostasis protein CutC [Labrys sp. LIt4]
MTALLEICVADADSLEAAIEGGADRIELCSALELGGLTPSSGLMRLAAQAPIPVYAMIRPRAGDFVFSPREGEIMLADIEAAGGAGLAGVVLGASLPGGRLDEALLSRLHPHTEGLGTTLHRAFDLVPDRQAALETAIALGFERILTSGGSAGAPAGLDELVRLHRAARGRIGIMPGSGLTPANIAALLAALPVTEVHSSCSAEGEPWSADAVRLGFAVGGRRRTRADIVRAFRAAMAGI